MATEKLYCTFYVDRGFFGIAVEEVQEVILNQPMTKVPLAASSIAGLMNLRGQIVTTIDMRRLMALPPAPDNVEPMNVVIRAEGAPVSLLVDDIGDVIDVSEADFESVPETVSGVSRELLEGVYKLDGKLLLVLNAHKILDDEPLAGAVTAAAGGSSHRLN